VRIAGEQALASFRQGLSGPRCLEQLKEAKGRLLIQLPVGVGKSTLLRQTVEEAVQRGTHDLVVVLVPLRAILDELVINLPGHLAPVVLRPRPRKKCGRLDAAWHDLEQRGCGALGRAQLCATCPLKRRCFWPRQLGANLRGARLILGTQQHLVHNPSFLLHLLHHARAKNPLLLLDESDLLLRCTERVVQASDLDHFVQVQQDILDRQEAPSSDATEWLSTTKILRQASTSDLREHWRFPWIDTCWAQSVQKRGCEMFGSAFHFVAYDLLHLAHSDPAGRERLDSGDVRFAARPYLGDRFVIFSGSMSSDLARFRLDPDHARPAVVSPFAEHRFEHPETSWINLRCLDGAARFFPSNAERLLDFFAELIARNIKKGRRTLLVSRKKFIPRCRDHLRTSLSRLGVGKVKIVTHDWSRHDLHDPRTIALINYRVMGVNCFEHVEAAYCLNSYYVSAGTISQAAQDIEATNHQFKISIRTTGEPRRRQAEVALPPDIRPITPRIAQQVLEQTEGDVVVQAVGRVRPFTRLREVITFHCGDLPGVRYNLELHSLSQARAYFGVRTPTQLGREERRQRACLLKASGCGVQEIADELQVSKATVKRDLRVGSSSLLNK
jgi:hypothetical protein